MDNFLKNVIKFIEGIGFNIPSLVLVLGLWLQLFFIIFNWKPGVLWLNVFIWVWVILNRVIGSRITQKKELA